MNDLFDYGTPSFKLARTGDPETSKEAAEQVETNRLEKMMHDTIRSFGDRGCISDEVRAKHPGLSYSSVTARFSALKEKGLIVAGPDKRPGRSGKNQFVMRSAEFVEAVA